MSLKQEGGSFEVPADALPLKDENGMECTQEFSKECKKDDDNNNNINIPCNSEEMPDGSTKNSNDALQTPLGQLFEGPIGYGEECNKSTDHILVYGCGICFTIAGCSQQSFQRHQREHHKQFLTCKICKRKFTTKIGYENHMMTHIRYPCSHCKKEFRHHIEVEEHQSKHFPQKLLRCERCGQEFYLRASLNQHRSFMGDECVQIQQSVMKIHQQLVTTKTEELVKCASGCANMIPKSRMEEHVKYHYKKWSASGRKYKKTRYECEICGAEFISCASLRVHKNEHDEEDEDDPGLVIDFEAM